MSWIEDAGEEFEGLDMTALMMDEAYLRLMTDTNAWLYTLSKDCYKCPYRRSIKVPALDNTKLKLNIAHPQFLRITNGDLGPTYPAEEFEDVLCDFSPEMGEFGVYDLNIFNQTCNFSVAKDPVNIYLPLLIIIMALLGVMVLCFIGRFIIEKITKKRDCNEMESKSKGHTRKRLKSLDTFRGFSIVLMIFVNDGAGGYWWLEHATWNGLTVADLVFPFFLWVMGVCIPISVKSIVSKHTPKYVALLQIFKRSCTLFLIGLALGSITDINRLRIFGVLQRFGVSYFIVASLVLILTRRNGSDIGGRFRKMFKDITDLGVEWIIMMILIVAHLLIVFLIPAPGCPTGYLGPGGMHENWSYENCTGGVTKHVDLLILGDGHIYQKPTANLVYDSGSFDPEGIFGCILSIVHVFFGVQAGYTLLHHVEWKPVVTRWLSWAVMTGIIGGVLCGFSKEDGIIPVNKNLWSLSFVLVTTSFSFIVLSMFYLLIDILKVWDGSPFVQPGMNPIVMYIGHSICSSIFPFHWWYEGMRTHFLHTIEAVWGTTLWVIIAYVLANKKIFIAV